MDQSYKDMKHTLRVNEQQANEKSGWVQKALGIKRSAHKVATDLAVDLLPAGTVWAGNLPTDIATAAQVKKLFEKEHGEVKTVTVRKKSGASNKERSWAFVTFASPESMANCLDLGVPVFDNAQGKQVDLWINLPATTGSGQGEPAGKKVSQGSGAMEAIAAQHNARDHLGHLRTNFRHHEVARKTDRTAQQMLDIHRLQKAERRRCFFMPHSTFRVAWDMLQIVFLLYVAVVYPVRQAWDTFPEPRGDNPAYLFDAVVDAFFAIDVVLNFRTAFIRSADDKIEVAPRKIARHYVCGLREPGGGWFAIDFVSCVPTSYIQLAMGGADNGGMGLEV
jgi:hypothetical protein